MSFLEKIRARLDKIGGSIDAGTQPTAGDIYHSIKDKWEELKALYVDYKSDGVLTLAEMWRLMNTGIGSLVKLAQQVGGANANKKAAVLALANDFYDDVVAPQDIAWVPNWIEPVVDSLLKQVVMVFVDGAIDAAVDMLKDSTMANS